jgi:hypothetical protein
MGDVVAVLHGGGPSVELLHYAPTIRENGQDQFYPALTG